MTNPIEPEEMTPESLDQMTQAWENMKAEFALVLSHYASWRRLPESMLHPLMVDDQLSGYLEKLNDPEVQGQAQGLIMCALDMLYDLAPEALRLAWAASGHSHD